MKTRVFVVCAVIFLFCCVAHADSVKLVNPANGHSYQRFDTAIDWNSAKTACAALGGHLATITSQAENDWIYGNLLNGAGIPSSFWLGGTDSDQEGVWKWITGESWEYKNWCPNEPNNACGGQNYVHIFSSQHPTPRCWDDSGGPGCYSTALYSYICEWDSPGTCSNDMVTFTAGTPAKAFEVNANFAAHNCQIQALQTQVQALKLIVCTDHPTASVCQ
jgi:hypothetical protein